MTIDGALVSHNGRVALVDGDGARVGAAADLPRLVPHGHRRYAVWSAARDLAPDITAHAPDAVDLSAPPRRSEAVEGGGESADASDPGAGEHRR